MSKIGQCLDVMFLRPTNTIVLVGLVLEWLITTRCCTQTFRTYVLHVLTPDKYHFVQVRWFMSDLCNKNGPVTTTINCCDRTPHLFFMQLLHFCGTLPKISDELPDFYPIPDGMKSQFDCHIVPQQYFHPPVPPPLHRLQHSQCMVLE